MTDVIIHLEVEQQKQWLQNWLEYSTPYQRSKEPAENLPDMHTWVGNSKRWPGDFIKQKERVNMLMCTFQKALF